MGSLIWSASLTRTARMEGIVVLGIAGELIVEQVTVKKISLIVGCGRGLALYHVRLIMEAVKEMPWHVRTLHCRTLDASATKQPMIRWPRRRATSPPTRHQPPSYRPVPRVHRQHRRAPMLPQPLSNHPSIKKRMLRGRGLLRKKTTKTFGLTPTIRTRSFRSAQISTLNSNSRSSLLSKRIQMFSHGKCGRGIALYHVRLIMEAISA
jgi:hypothetical protein